MPRRAGLAHVATSSFLASRVAPTAGYAVALAGGVAVARASQRWGARTGWGASGAALLQTIAIMGPLRLNIPFTQAISAPVLGRMEARGFGTPAQVTVTAIIRALDQVATAALYIGIILGLEAYTGSYERFFGFLPLPEGNAGAIIATGIGLFAWTAFASTLQVLVYRRGLSRWPEEADAVVPPPEPAPVETGTSTDVAASGDAGASPGAADVSGEAAPSADPTPRAAARPASRFDPRAVVLAGVVATALLLASTAWLLLAAIVVWLGVAWFAGGGDTSVVKAGLILTAIIAWGALSFGFIGGLGVDETLRRTLRAALLVLVATWVRYAAGEPGLREVFRRMLRRLRRLPAAPEAAGILDRLGSTDDLVHSGRTLIDRVKDVPREAVPIADAVLDWVVHESGRFAGVASAPIVPPPATALRARLRDAVLVALAIATVVALPLAH